MKIPLKYISNNSSNGLYEGYFTLNFNLHTVLANFILIPIFHAACLLEVYLKRKTFQTKS